MDEKSEEAVKKDSIRLRTGKQGTCVTEVERSGLVREGRGRAREGVAEVECHPREASLG